jgi:hypothetical protein
MSLLRVSVFDHHQEACTEPGETYIKTLGKIRRYVVVWQHVWE